MLFCVHLYEVLKVVSSEVLRVFDKFHYIYIVINHLYFKIQSLWIVESKSVYKMRDWSFNWNQCSHKAFAVSRSYCIFKWAVKVMSICLYVLFLKKC